MKYSLRSLFVVVTLMAALLGVRIEYLRRGWSYHANEAKRLLSNRHLSGDEALRNAAAALEHVTLTARFRYAIRRPWSIVDTTPPKTTNDETAALINGTIREAEEMPGAQEAELIRNNLPVQYLAGPVRRQSGQALGRR